MGKFEYGLHSSVGTLFWEDFNGTEVMWKNVLISQEILATVFSGEVSWYPTSLQNDSIKTNTAKVKNY